MSKGHKLTASSYIEIDGTMVRWDSLTESRRNEYSRRITANIGKALEWYLSANYEEVSSLEKFMIGDEGKIH